MGVPVPGTEIEIVDVETGTRVLPRGESGEIRARGPQLMSGYRNRPLETAQALRDGWLYPGDIGAIDDHGVLSIRDRRSLIAGYWPPCKYGEVRQTSTRVGVSNRSAQPYLSREPTSCIFMSVYSGAG